MSWRKKEKITNVIFQCCGSGMSIPAPGSDFFPSRIPDPSYLHPGSRGQKGTGSRIRIRNTVIFDRIWQIQSPRLKRLATKTVPDALPLEIPVHPTKFFLVARYKVSSTVAITAEYGNKELIW
jgi:hypothetical protein